MAKATKTLSVRIDSDTFDRFNIYTKGHNVFTQANIVESLIDYFMKQSEEQKHLLVRGVGSDYVDLVTEALQLVTWGDHAFSGSHLPWVIETYNELNNIAAEARRPTNDAEWEADSDAESEADGKSDSETKPTGLLSLRRIAWFKLGRAWIDIARGLRAKALVGLAHHLKPSTGGDATPDDSKPDDWAELYNAAIDSFRIAVANFRLFNQSLQNFGKDPHPTVLYNQACVWSLTAQYIAERDAKNKALDQLAKDALEDEKKKKREAEEQTLSGGRPPSDIPEADTALRNAYVCLKEITVNYKEGTEDIPMGDARWLFDFAKHDPDLDFFRDKRDSDFNNWRSKQINRISILDSYKHLRRNLPKVAEKIVNELTRSEVSDAESKTT